MRTPLSRITATVLTSLLVSLLASCEKDKAIPATPGSAATTSPVDVAATTAPTVQLDASTVSSSIAPVDETTTVAPTVAATDGPITDPCALLTASVATAALGVAVGEPLRQPGEGNETCAFHPADTAAKGFVYLTTYSAEGSPELLAEAATTFRDAESVDGLGDAAVVSLEGQAVGVLFGHTVFALGLILQSSDGQVQPITKDQLIAAARSVLDGQ
jgi:hypothetical protein